MARPIKYQPDDIIDALSRYIDNTDDPLIVEFCVNYGISKDRLYDIATDNQAISDAIKRAHDKDEVYLLRHADDQKTSTFSIFRLKQPVHGYTDKQDIKVSGNVSIVDDLSPENA